LGDANLPVDVKKITLYCWIYFAAMYNYYRFYVYDPVFMNVKNRVIIKEI